MQRHVPFLYRVLTGVLICGTLFSLTSVISPTTASATTYYVDNTITNTNVGSSTPDCTTYNINSFTCSGGSGKAFATIADITAFSTLQPDDQVLFRKGQTFRELLLIPASGTSGHPIVFSSYGSGAEPVITGSDIVTSWTAQGTPNVWQATLTTQTYLVYMDGNRGTLKGSIGALASEYDFYWSANVLYIYSPTDPNTRYASTGVEAAIRYAAVRTNSKNYLTINGLVLEKGNTASGEFGYGLYVSHSHDVSVTNSTMSRNYFSGVEAYGSENAYISISNSTLSSNGEFGFHESDQSGGHNSVSSSYVQNNGWRAVNAMAGILGDFSNGGSVSGNIVSSNGLGDPSTNLSHGIYIANNPGTTLVQNNTVYGNRAMGIQSRASVTIRNNITYNNGIAGIVVGDCSTAMTALVYNNISYNNKFGIEVGKFTGSTVTASVYNNTLYHNDSTRTTALQPAELDVEDDVTSFTFQNNIVYPSLGQRAYRVVSIVTNSIFDYNNIYRSDSGTLFGYNTASWSDETWSEWRSKGFDLHSINLEPHLINPAGSDFRLLVDSSAKDAGINLSSVFTSDIVGSVRPQGTSFDIGAYEYVASTGTGGASGTFSSQSQTPHLYKFQSGAIRQQDVLSIVNTNTFKWDTYLAVNSVPKSTSFKIPDSNYWQVGSMYDIWWKAFFNDAKILPAEVKQPFIVAIPYTLGSLEKSLSEKNLKLAYSSDERKTWKVLLNSVLDTKNKTVSVVTKNGGYYMLVSGYSNSSSSQQVKGKKTEEVFHSNPTPIPTTVPQPTIEPVPTPSTTPTPQKRCILFVCF